MQTPMKTLQLPEELVDTLQAEALQVGMTIADYISDLVLRPSKPDALLLTPELKDYLDEGLLAMEQGTHIPHEEVLARLARYQD